MADNRIKVYITVGILLVGAVLTIVAGIGSGTTTYQNDGTAIDFGGMNVSWTDIEPNKLKNAKNALEYACDYHVYPLSFDSEGKITQINGVISDGEHNWDLWIVKKNETVWNKLEAPYDEIDLTDYAISSWAYCSADEEPTVAVDQSGRSIYGYGQSYRTVTLSPSITEIVASMGAATSIVGMDKYSNYPKEVVQRYADGDIRIVGDYTTPVFEEIVRTNPDMVLCDGSQYNHIKMNEKLRDNNYHSVLLYDGESLDTIVKNMYITGIVLHYEIGAIQKIIDILNAATQLETIIATSGSATTSDVMMALSPSMSPYVSGDHTYVSDVMVRTGGINVFSDFNGWVQINSEQIMNKNPEVVIIVTTDYRATQEEYDAMIASLSSEWKATRAYQNGEIYLLGDGAGEMGMRPSSRATQLMELCARILNPSVFTDISIPKYIGDDYRDYLTYTKYLE